jgi:hypothetical protein
MTHDNAVLVNPSGKIPAYDNMFFKEGLEFNQGNIFDWEEEEFISSMETTEKRFRNSPENIDGLKLQEQFTYKKMVDSILDITQSI